MFDWAEKMIEDMKKNGEINDSEREGGKENELKLSEDDLNKLSKIVIQQLNNQNSNENESENESEDES